MEHLKEASPISFYQWANFAKPTKQSVFPFFSFFFIYFNFINFGQLKDILYIHKVDFKSVMHTSFSFWISYSAVWSVVWMDGGKDHVEGCSQYRIRYNVQLIKDVMQVTAIRRHTIMADFQQLYRLTN